MNAYLIRTRHEVAADILKVAQKGAIKTRIVYGANLNFGIIKKYLEKPIPGKS